MSLLQIQVTKCEDCPFMNTDSNHLATHEYTCNAKDSKNIDDYEQTPDWCPLLKDDFIEVYHVMK